MGNYMSRLLWLYFKSKGFVIKIYNWEENVVFLIREVGFFGIYFFVFIKNKNKKEEKSYKKIRIFIYYLFFFRLLVMLLIVC